jgi:ADP-ribose pyrophosphatase
MPITADWEELKREVTYHKYSQTIERRDYKMPDGRLEDYYVRVEHAGACVLAITTGNRVITLPQYRPGRGKVLRELPGGMVDDGEDPHKAAQRELLEETGYEGELVEWVGKWYSDAYTDSDRTIVIIKNCRKVAEPKLEITEFGEVELVSIPDFVQQVRTGQLTDVAGAILALDHLGLLS